MKKEDKKIVEKSNSILLDRFIQRTLTNQVQHVDEKSIAMAIKTLLQEEKDNKTLH